MKTKNFFLATIATLFGVIVESSGQTNNTFTGTGAGTNNTGSTNSGFGVNSLLNNTSNSNSAFGVGTLTFNTGGFNSAFGASSLASNTSGTLNCAFGTRSMELNTTGTHNVAMGHRALEFNTTGSYNVAIGYGALYRQNNPPNPNLGSYNIAIGANTPRNLMSGNLNVFLGYETAVNLVNGSNNVIIGGVSFDPGPSTATLAGNDTSNSIILATGSWSQPSSQKLFIRSNGYMGVGLGNNQIPQNRLEINSVAAVAGTTGLRFRGFNNTLASPNGRVLTVNTNGDVVLTTDQGSGGSTLIQAGTNVTVTGTGVVGNPFIINSLASGCNLYSCDGTLNTVPTNANNPNPGLRTVTMGNNNLFFDTSSSVFANGTAGSGRVYIGNNISFPNLNNTAPNISQYRLLVEGGILTERVKVATNGTVNWADYVFADDYKLMPLKEVETFIANNNHLPGIESAETLSKEGLDLGDMQAKQMAKIEELTLYIIQQNKEIEELKAQMKLVIEKTK